MMDDLYVDHYWAAAIAKKVLPCLARVIVAQPTGGPDALDVSIMKRASNVSRRKQLWW